jgi:hypothetical protein
LNLRDIVKSFLAVNINSPIDDVLQKISLAGTHRFEVPASFASDLDNLKLDELSKTFQTLGNTKIPSDLSQLHLVVIEKNHKWNLTDLTTMHHYQLEKKSNVIVVSLEAQFYFAPEQTYIGTAPFPAGFYINGALDILGFRATATISIDANRGICIDGKMSKIIIGKESLLSITAAQGNGGAQVSVASYSLPSAQEPLLRSPHFYLNGQISLLGVKQGVFITISSSGAQFEIKGNLAPRMSFDLLGHFSDPQNLGVGGSASAGIGKVDLGKLGKVKLDTDVKASLNLGVQGQKIFAEVKASFGALGHNYQIASFQLDTQTSALADLANTIEKKVESVFNDLFKDVNQWSKAVQNGCVEGVDDVGKVLTDVYSMSTETANKVLNSMGKETIKVVNSIGNTAVSTGTAIVKDTGSALNSAGKSITGLFSKKKKKH